MKPSHPNTAQADSQASPPLTLGDYAHTVLRTQYQTITKYEKKVLADNDPENLHDMRVGTRKLRTALQVFQGAIALPKAASIQQVGFLTKVLGRLRDLDVQIADLKTTYLPRLQGSEAELLTEVITALKKKRRRAFAAVEDGLGRSRYRNLKNAYETWLERPQFTPLAQLPIEPLLPDLLSPLLAELLLHPGWLVPANYTTVAEGETLHDLRKACKHARYQAEFFLSFYSTPFRAWVQEIKQLQDKLGQLQDSHVLLDLLAHYLPSRAELPTLHTYIHQTQVEALDNWDPLRQKYLNPTFRHQLHRMVLEPGLPPSQAEPKSPAPSPKTARKSAAKTIHTPDTASRTPPNPRTNRKK